MPSAVAQSQGRTQLRALQGLVTPCLFPEGCGESRLCVDQGCRGHKDAGDTRTEVWYLPIRISSVPHPSVLSYTQKCPGLVALQTLVLFLFLLCLADGKL